ncbi:MAG: DUF4199 domain-containing protein [Muribaculaceae bacterium]|nr:DUF4199 domain-containing protein [Muribaculaceae bacterium]
MSEPKKSIYQRAGEWGIPFGLYLSCAAVASIYADKFQPLSLVFFILLIGTPLLTYYYQRRKFIEDDGFTEYAGLWMLGILLFILGSVISSLVVYLVLQYWRPEFMYEQAQLVLDTYKDMPEMKDSDVMLVLRRLVDERLMPSPIQTVFNAFWFVTFGGSMVSAITALIAQRKPKKRDSL